MMMRSRWKTGLAALVALLAAAGLMLSPLIIMEAFRFGRGQFSAAADAASGHVGQVVRDGKVDFTVNRVQCGLSSIGGLSNPANGQYCAVAVTMRNDSDNPVTLDGSAQLATGSRGAV